MQYFDEILKACGIAVICVILLVLLRTTASGIAVAIRIGGVILIFGVFLYVKISLLIRDKKTCK